MPGGRVHCDGIAFTTEDFSIVGELKDAVLSRAGVPRCRDPEVSSQFAICSRSGQFISEYDSIIDLPSDDLTLQMRLNGGLPAAGTRPTWKLFAVAGIILPYIVLKEEDTWAPYYWSLRDAERHITQFTVNYNTWQVSHDQRGGNHAAVTGDSSRSTDSVSVFHRWATRFHVARRLENARWVTPRGTTEDVILMPDGRTPAFFPELRAAIMHDAFQWNQSATRDLAKFWDTKFFNNSLSSWQDEYLKVPMRTQRKLRALALEDEVNWLKGTHPKTPLAVPLPTV